MDSYFLIGAPKTHCNQNPWSNRPLQPDKVDCQTLVQDNFRSYATLHNKIENIKCQKVQMVDVKMIKWYKPGSQTTILSPIARKIRAAPDVHLGVNSLLIQVLEEDLQDLQTFYQLSSYLYWLVSFQRPKEAKNSSPPVVQRSPWGIPPCPPRPSGRTSDFAHWTCSKLLDSCSVKILLDCRLIFHCWICVCLCLCLHLNPLQVVPSLCRLLQRAAHWSKSSRVQLFDEKKFP